MGSASICISKIITVTIRGQADAMPQRLGLTENFIHFALYEANNGQATHGAQISFRVLNLDRAHTRAVRAGARIIHEPKPQPWGLSARYFDFDDNVIELTQQA